MKLLVDELPTDPAKCPYSQWHLNPPTAAESGYYSCYYTCSKEPKCNLGSCEGECLMFKVANEKNNCRRF